MKVFVSYRHMDTQPSAARLHQDLLQSDFVSSIFVDHEEVENGEDFSQRIGKALRHSDIVIALIGENWEVDLSSGTAEHSDWVERELFVAFQLDIPVLPVLVDRKHLPQSSELPAGLQRLATIKPCALRTAPNKAWESDILELAESIGKLLPNAKTSKKSAIPQGFLANLAHDGAEQPLDGQGSINELEKLVPDVESGAYDDNEGTLREIQSMPFPNEVLDRRTHRLVDPANWRLGRIEELVQSRAIRLVENQDWQVDRIVPPFVGEVGFKALTQRLSGLNRPNILHLGVGDGRSNRVFRTQVGEKLQSVCYSKNIDVDPTDALVPIVERALPDITSKALVLGIAKVLRNEFLLPLNIPKVLRYQNLGEVLQRKDWNILERIDNAESIFEALVEVLHEAPGDLLPHLDSNNEHYQRLVTDLGTFIKRRPVHEAASGSRVELGNEQKGALRSALERLRDRPSLLQGESKDRTRELLLEGIFRLRHSWKDMHLGRFEDLSRSTSATEEVRKRSPYHAIIGCRSDAFLDDGYADFLPNIAKLLHEDGVYISDGIVSSYTYCFYRQRFLAALPKLCGQQGLVVYLVVNRQAPLVSEQIPPRSLEGIIITKNKDHPFVGALATEFQGSGELEVIPAINLFDPAIERQCAWSQLYLAVREHNFIHPESAISIEKGSAEVERAIQALMFSTKPLQVLRGELAELRKAAPATRHFGRYRGAQRQLSHELDRRIESLLREF